MDRSEVLKKVRYIEISTRKIVNEVLAGAYESIFKGRGIEFSQVREYVYNDDYRIIDWNTSARTGKLHIKEFEEERELTVILAIDVSGSQFYGSSEMSKMDVILQMSAAIGFSAIRNNDRVGLLLFSDTVHKFISPKKGSKNILRVLKEILDSDYSARETNISLAMEYLNNIQKRKAIVFLFSDFYAGNYEKAIAITGRRHDLISIAAFDPLEKELPKAGLVPLRDMETGGIRLIDTSSSRKRRLYREQFEKHIFDIKKMLSRYNIDFIYLMTNENYESALIKFFKSREKRRLREV